MNIDTILTYDLFNQLATFVSPTAEPLDNGVLVEWSWEPTSSQDEDNIVISIMEGDPTNQQLSDLADAAGVAITAWFQKVNRRAGQPAEGTPEFDTLIDLIYSARRMIQIQYKYPCLRSLPVMQGLAPVTDSTIST